VILMRTFLFTIIGLALFGCVNAAQLEQLRVSTDAQKTRLVFDLSDTTPYKSFTLKNPDRLVVDFQKSRVAKSFVPLASESPLLRNVRFAERNDGSVRVVLDLTAAVSEKSFTLAPKGSEGHRVVMDLSSDAIVAEAPNKVAEPKKELRDVVVAVDAGHGGKDPGAIGLRGKAREKRVTLQIARRVKRLIDAQPGMRAVLIRSGDYYVPLRKRTQIAREHEADLFVSIHADAFRKSHVHGASVFVVSNRGASSEMARWLANRENASDLAGGVAISDVSDDVAKTLLDLSRTGSQEASYKAAEKVHQELDKIGKMHSRRVQNAGFMVLKSPDIPSMLVETGFISNTNEARRLTNGEHQEKIANSIVNGVRAYFEETPPPDTKIAQQVLEGKPKQHVISRGDTLSEIADRYEVSLNDLKSHNRISDARLIRIGQVLNIPQS